MPPFELACNIMTRRSQAWLVSIGQKVFHADAVGFQDSSVRGLGTWRLGKPPDWVDGILDPHPADVYPLGWSWKLRWVVPVELLSQVKAICERKKEFKVVECPRRHAPIPAPPHMNNKAAILLENPAELSREWRKPLHVFFSAYIPVSFLLDQCERRGCHNEGNGFVGNPLAESQ